MKRVLARWNELDADEAPEEILPCCGSRAWARQMSSRRPVSDEAALLAASDEIWATLAPTDWIEAFESHPRIGERRPKTVTSARGAAWSSEEQKKVSTATEELQSALADGNYAYEQRFHRIFIVCASGKSPAEILELLKRRLHNDESTELAEAAEQQRQITHLRLKKWLS